MPNPSEGSVFGNIIINNTNMNTIGTYVMVSQSHVDSQYEGMETPDTSC